MESKLTANISRDELDRIMREHGPQFSEMYFHPTTVAEHEANRLEYLSGMQRVIKHIRDNYSEVKPDGRED